MIENNGYKFVEHDDKELVDLIRSLASNVRLENVVGCSRGMCGVTSVKLRKALLEHGIWCTLKEGHAKGECQGNKLSLKHKWLQVGDWFVDVTLDQFKHFETFYDAIQVSVLKKKPGCLESTDDFYEDNYGFPYRPVDDFYGDTMHPDVLDKYKNLGRDLDYV